MPIKHTFDFIKFFIEKEDYLLLDNEYINSFSKLILQCPLGHVFPMSFKVFRKGHRCSYCAGKRQYNIQEVRGFFEEKGYKLLSKQYVNNKASLEVLGPDGKKYSTTLFSFKVSNIIPHLKGNNFKTEEHCRSVIESITGKKFPKIRPDWLVNPQTGYKLELDGYCEELKLAFEYDGMQHFRNNTIFKKLQETNNRDNIKNELCGKNKVRLIRIPYYIKDKDTFIKNEIKYSGKILYIGDPHVQIKNIKDSLKLVNFIEKKSRENSINSIVFLGDLLHTHGAVKLEIQYFWKDVFEKLLKQFKLYILIGNHDMILGDSEFSGLSSLDIFKEKYRYTFNIINEPAIHNNIGFMPYQQKINDFLENSKILYEQGATKCLIAHQTFTGAQYENGFYAPDGIDPELIPQEQIISGHIHKSQQIGKCFYTGTPKWDTMSDANEDKGIWIFNHSNDGSVLSKEFISTKEVVTPIYKFTIHEGDELPELKENARNYLEFHGKTAWITKMKKIYKGKANIKAKPTDRKTPKIDKDKKLDWGEYLKQHFTPINGVTKKDIKTYLEALNE